MIQRRIPALALSLTLLAAACSTASAENTSTTEPAPTSTTASSSTTTSSSTTSSSTTTTTEPAGPPGPLNGLAVDDPTLLDRRVIAVKIDNHWNARPQSGIEQADAVFELLVEAGLTRFIAMFHTSDVDYLGPMRSGRPTDPTLLRPLGATFTISGAQNWVLSRIRNAGVPLLGEIRPATFRVSGRFAPHNLYVDTNLLREAADTREFADEQPPPLFVWGDPLTDGEAATTIDFDWSQGLKVSWEWDGEQYLRSTGGQPHQWVTRDHTTQATEDETSEDEAPEDETTEEPEETIGQITTDTLVVLFASRYTASGSSGSSVPAMDTLGSGRALVFSDGLVVEGTWERETIEEPFALLDADGNTLSVPSGHPWISVFPNSRTVTW